MKKIAAVISYSSYHNAFIDRTVKEAEKVCDYVLVVSYKDFFDNVKDDALIPQKNHLILENSPSKPSRWHHNESRRLGYETVKLTGEYDFIFFIDSDEVLEGDRVKLWLDTVEQGESYKLAHFWYYRDTCYRADKVEEGAVLVAKETLESPTMNWQGNREREDFTTSWNYMASYQNKVLGHHYSWAGTEEMLIKKVKSWGHNEDNLPWQDIVRKEFQHDFNYTCPFKPYTFTKIEPYIGFTFHNG